MCIIGRYRHLILIVGLCVCNRVYARWAWAYVCEHKVRVPICVHKMWLCVSSKRVCMYVGGFRTLGLHRVEGTAQELLIERDLRDMAEVSMLRHAATGLWWAVKTSRGLRTTDVCVCVCMSLCGCAGICVVFVIMCSCSARSECAACLYACTVLCWGARSNKERSPFWHRRG